MKLFGVALLGIAALCSATLVLTFCFIGACVAFKVLSLSGPHACVSLDLFGFMVGMVAGTVGFGLVGGILIAAADHPKPIARTERTPK